MRYRVLVVSAASIAVAMLIAVGCGESGHESRGGRAASSAPSAEQDRLHEFGFSVKYPLGVDCRLDGTERSVMALRGKDAAMDTNVDGKVDAVLMGRELYLSIPAEGSEAPQWWRVNLQAEKEVSMVARGITPGLDAGALLGNEADPFRVPQRRADSGERSPGEVFPGDPNGGMMSWQTASDGKVTEVVATFTQPDLGQARSIAVEERSPATLELPNVDALNARPLADAPAAEIVPLSYALHEACSERKDLDWTGIKACVDDLTDGKTVETWVDEVGPTEALRPSACFPADS